jgi:TolB-like protein
MSLLGELKRRNVFRVGAAYVVTSWLVIQVVETIFPAFGFGAVAVRIATIVLAIGLVPVLVFAWAFELTPEGLKKEKDVDRSQSIAPQTGKKLDGVIMIVLAVALGYFAFDKFVLEPQREAVEAEQQQVEVQRAREEGRSEARVESYGDASIAVLAFRNMSPDSEQEFFADGVSEEILNLLAAIPELRVISRSSAFTYKDRDVPIPQVAHELNVAHVLEGSVRKAGDRIRVTAQLIEGRTDTHLWSQTWDRTLDDVFAIQDEIAADVVSQLRVSLVGALPKTRRTDPEVYALTLQARQLLESAYDSAQLPRVNDLLVQALTIDPLYVPALEAKIHLDRLMMKSGLLSRQEVDQRWSQDRGRILAVDAKNGVVASFDALVLYQKERDIEASAAIYESLLSTHPNDAEVLRVIGGFLRRVGFFEESVSVLKRCVLVDPLKHGCAWRLKESLLWAGQLEASREHAERFNQVRGFAGSNDIYRTLLEGRASEAWDLALATEPLDPINRDILLALAAHDLGDQEAFKHHLNEALASEPEDHPESLRRLLAMAGMYAYIGDPDQAFAYLDEAMVADEISVFLEIMSPWYWPLHQDPRWTALRQRLGVSEARLAAIEFSIPEDLWKSEGPN